jgi:starch synthase
VLASTAPVNVLFLTSEVHPFAKTGGLGDVSAALPAALHRAGHDVRVFLPLYGRIDLRKHRMRRVESLRDLRVSFGGRAWTLQVLAAQLPGTALEVFFLHCPELYGRQGIYTHDADEHLRFLVLSYGALTAAQRMRFAPDVVHCNDWPTALTPLLLETRFAWDKDIFGRAKTVLTIHNLNYQGMFPAQVLPDTGLGDSAHLFHQDQLREGRINFLLHGVLYADALTTVSPTYAREIRTPDYGAGLDGLLRARGNALSGILNGIDHGEWNPATDAHLPARYSPADLSGKLTCKKRLLASAHLPYLEGAPLFAIVSRLAGQKGLELVPEALAPLLRRHPLQLVVLGSGERRLVRMLRELERHFPRQVRFRDTFDVGLSHRIEAGADFFLMPSRYEPCGLNQMYSLKYGTVPVVRKTGGLSDTVRQWNPRTGEGTGILFEHHDAAGLRWAVETALKLYKDPAAFRRLQEAGMAEDFSWDAQVAEYEQVYSRGRAPHTKG